ncbi:MAG: hypothetical protein QG661_2285 [Actinomycetota bacterium]|nr:hypothetical protein [Actinomycetota bacterium]
MRVLFTGGGGAGTQALWELLEGRHEVHFCDPDPRRISAVVPDDRAHAVPMADDPAYLDAVVRLCRDASIDVIVPGVDEELEPLARHRGALAPTSVLLPESSFVETMLDKLAFTQALAGAGIRVPRTLPLGSSARWTAFPAIVKPRHGRGSRGVRVVDDVAALAALREALAEAADTFIVQELIRGEEYTVQVMVNGHGALRAVFPVHVLAKRGVTISAVAADSPGVRAVCERIHEATEAQGCYNVQGMLDEHGVFVPFELNPRVSTTVCLAVAAGLDPLELCFDSVEGQPLEEFEDGIRLERYWHNEIIGTADEDRGRLR